MKKRITNYELDRKVDNFIDWYSKNMLEYDYCYTDPKKLENFIEKMAVWYELRYPDYEVNRLMPGSNQESKNITEEMFYKNKNINNLLGDYNNEVNLNWSNFYNFDIFVNSLPREESYILDGISFPDLIYVTINGVSAHLHLNSDGTINEAERIGLATKGKIKDIELKGIPIKDLHIFLSNIKIKLPKNNPIEYTINKFNKIKYYREELLNCVMYRIIERGGNRIGSRRAFLFAKEFNRNIDIPMMYGVDLSDPGLRLFINEYLKSGGKNDLTCLIDYHSKDKYLNTITIQELLKTITNYTEEENQLHQQLVNLLFVRSEDEKARENLKKIKEINRYNRHQYNNSMLIYISKKIENNRELTTDELRFLYEIDDHIGYIYEDSVIAKNVQIKKEILKTRNQREDLSKIFNCKPSQISFTEEEALSGDIIYHKGNLDLSHLKNAEGIILPKIVDGSISLYSLENSKGLKLPKLICYSISLANLKNTKNLMLPDVIMGDLILDGLKYPINYLDEPEFSQYVKPYLLKKIGCIDFGSFFRKTYCTSLELKEAKKNIIDQIIKENTEALSVDSTNNLESTTKQKVKTIFKK